MTAEIDKASIWGHVEFRITAWDDVTGPFKGAPGTPANAPAKSPPKRQ